MTSTRTLRDAAANQNSHWLARALLYSRMELAAEFSAGKARVAAILRAELERRGIPTKTA